MYAVVKIKGHQYRVQPDGLLQVELIDSEVGQTVTFDEVLMVSDGDDVKVGAPHVDGATVDAEGCYWLAHVRGSEVCRYTPKGELDMVIELPVSKPTMCAFGGTDLKTLFITSISYGLSEEELAPQPLAGALFAIKLDVQGLAEAKFAG